MRNARFLDDSAVAAQRSGVAGRDLPSPTSSASRPSVEQQQQQHQQGLPYSPALGSIIRRQQHSTTGEAAMAGSLNQAPADPIAGVYSQLLSTSIYGEHPMALMDHGLVGQAQFGSPDSWVSWTQDGTDPVAWGLQTDGDFF
ncbi:hypothetical protein MAPG_01938 [Magnaporthiopsis poae ATCC 64411]|uniref:Uncharacterized protein n=1 Tax=Magnaporthiopsis poae (strain ATCC 64411 / 73-15) TaxID=644358 RepID=A0A0C4DQ06_MAGP6|nr:hypothetical protein MAPG_01938 [Magnaporthiopsis poae ATCC 64411]